MIQSIVVARFIGQSNELDGYSASVFSAKHVSSKAYIQGVLNSLTFGFYRL
jgi:hypothetical protein